MARVTLNQSDQEFSKVLDYFKGEISKLRSGRANPDLVADVKVAAYGQSMPLNQVANINVADATLLIIQPWDKTIIDEIRKALINADLGISPVVDGEIIRLPLPPLTAERRQEYVKVLRQKAEEAKISIRQVRKEVLDGLEQSQAEGVLSEDELKRQEKVLQSKVDGANEQVDLISAEKEKDLMQV